MRAALVRAAPGLTRFGLGSQNKTDITVEFVTDEGADKDKGRDTLMEMSFYVPLASKSHVRAEAATEEGCALRPPHALRAPPGLPPRRTRLPQGAAPRR